MRLRCASIEARAPSTSSSTRARIGPLALPDPLDDDLDGRDVEAGEPLDLVGDLGAHRRRHLGEVEAVLDDDVQLDAEALRRPLDLDPLAPEHALDPRAGGEPDDAVAAERGLGDDLGDRLARDGE